MLCNNCGSNNSSENVFCQQCGARLTANTEPISENVENARSTSYIRSAKQGQQEETPSTQKTLNYTKISALLGIIAYILPIIAILVGVPLIYEVRESIHSEINYFALLFNPFLFMLSPSITVIDPRLSAAATGFGITFILFGICAFILGIISRRLRRNAVYHEPESSLKSIGGIFAVLGIILAFVSGVIGFILFRQPTFASSYYPFF
ncbi:MAG: membrane protein of unknown function [Promethearchaeota archaeon]|nr:MAG: membrane protein of unknown function [Candidatus Lokiarchaeota archaeon]